MPATNWPTATSWPSATAWPSATSWPSGAPAYNLLADATLLAMWEPSSGLTQMATNGVDGNLTTVGGAIPIGGSFDGLPAYQIAAKTGTTGYYRSAVTTRFDQPVHTFHVGRFGAAATINTAMIASAAGGVANFDYWNGTNCGLNGGAVTTIATTPLAFHLYEIYWHSNFTFVSIDGGAFTKYNAGTGGDWGGTIFGAQFGGANPTDCDILAFLKIEGQASEQLRNAAFARYKAMFPTTLTLPASPPAGTGIVTATVAPALWTYTNPWDAVICIGQSNISNYATDNISAAWAANTYLLGNDYAWKAGGNPAVAFQWDSQTSQTDTVSIDGVTSRGSLAGALANALQAAYGRPLVLVPCVLSASYVVPGTNPALPLWSWGRTVPRGNNLRNSLYWSAVARAKEVIRWGGTIRGIVWYQGETEAQNASGAIRAAWPAAAQDLIDNFWTDIGLPNPRFNVGDRSRTTVIVRIAGNANSNWTDFRTNVVPTITQNANQILVDAPVAGPFEVDGIHLTSAPLDVLGALIATAILS